MKVITPNDRKLEPPQLLERAGRKPAKVIDRNGDGRTEMQVSQE